jgi:hypothetical protein
VERGTPWNGSVDHWKSISEENRIFRNLVLERRMLRIKWTEYNEACERREEESENYVEHRAQESSTR